MKHQLKVHTLLIHLVVLVGSRGRKTHTHKSDSDYVVLFEDTMLLGMPATFDKSHSAHHFFIEELNLPIDTVFVDVKTFLTRVFKQQDSNDLDVLFGKEVLYSSPSWDRVNVIKSFGLNKDQALVRLVGITSSKSVTQKRLGTTLAQALQLANDNKWVQEITSASHRQLVTHPNNDELAKAKKLVDAIELVPFSRNKDVFNTLWQAFTCSVVVLPVVTEMFDSLVYDFAYGRLTVVFQGGDVEYIYHVNPSKVKEMLESDSIGKFFHENVKGQSCLLK